MKWRRDNSNYNISSNYTAQWNNCITFPVYYNGKIYGTDQNRMAIVFRTGTSYRDVRYRNCPVYGVEQNFYSYRVFGVDDSYTDIAEMENSKIFGKYRFGEIFGAILSGVGFPLNFSFALSDGTIFEGNGFKSQPGSVSFPDSVASNVTWASVGAESIQKNWGYSTSTTLSIPAPFANSVVDFGITPQNVPKVFYDWLNVWAEPVYPNTYDIKSQDGETEFTKIEESPPMTSANLSVVGNTKTLVLTGNNGKNYTLTWTSQTPTGKSFRGLAYEPNAKRAAIPIAIDVPVVWDNSITLYEVYGTYRPPETTFGVNLYQNSAEVNRVDKTNYLQSVGNLFGALREECSIMSPTITFKQSSVPTFNYVYIPIFQRYYFVTGITSVSKDLWRMALSCDVLMTWSENIGLLRAVIARQENSYNAMLQDTELPAQANQSITVEEFPAGAFGTINPIDFPFVLTVVGG